MLDDHNEYLRLKAQLDRANNYHYRMLSESNNRELTLQKVRHSINELITFMARLQDIAKHHESWKWWDYYKKSLVEMRTLVRFCEGAKADIKRLEAPMPD